MAEEQHIVGSEDTRWRDNDIFFVSTNNNPYPKFVMIDKGLIEVDDDGIPIIPKKGKKTKSKYNNTAARVIPFQKAYKHHIQNGGPDGRIIGKDKYNYLYRFSPSPSPNESSRHARVKDEEQEMKNEPTHPKYHPNHKIIRRSQSEDLSSEYIKVHSTESLPRIVHAMRVINHLQQLVQERHHNKWGLGSKNFKEAKTQWEQHLASTRKQHLHSTSLENKTKQKGQKRRNSL